MSSVLLLVIFCMSILTQSSASIEELPRFDSTQQLKNERASMFGKPTILQPLNQAGDETMLNRPSKNKIAQDRDSKVESAKAAARFVSNLSHLAEKLDALGLTKEEERGGDKKSSAAILAKLRLISKKIRPTNYGTRADMRKLRCWFNPVSC